MKKSRISLATTEIKMLGSMYIGLDIERQNREIRRTRMVTSLGIRSIGRETVDAKSQFRGNRSRCQLQVWADGFS